MQSGNVLIVDDEAKLRSLLKRVIALEGYAVFEAGDLRTATRIIDREDIEVVVCDVKLPDGNGLEFIKQLKTKTPFSEIILLTAYGNISDSVQAMKNGAFDYITKGDDNEKLVPILGHAIEKSRLQKRVQQLEQQVIHAFSFDNIIGESPAFL
ncbi:MAG TPA: response regulator, partial [Puia sp.]|nr:response regulator [Puia sp.]